MTSAFNPTSGTLNLSNFDILIVDDCQISSMYLFQLVKQLGFTQIDKAYSYQDAIKCCAKKRYALLFIDFHLEQAINGSELHDLLKEKGFISPYTRVITVSGDNTTQTVIGTISKGQGDYLCKPINKATLQNKIQNAFSEYQLFKKLYKLLEQHKYDELLSTAVSIAAHKNIVELDIFLIDFLYEHDKNLLLKLTQETTFSNRKNYILARLKVQDEKKLLHPLNLIQATTQLCEKHPLFVQAFDFLSLLQINIQHYEESLNSALNALALTTRSPHRSLSVLKLSLICNDKSEFLKASHLLASHLPISSPSWCSYLSECLSYFNSYIQQTTSEIDKKQLILEQKNFVRRCEYRLTEKQKVQLNILYNYSISKRLIEEGQIAKAKRLTLKATTSFYDNLHQLNTIVLIELMYLLSFFGELWLMTKVNTVLKTKTNLDNYCRDCLNILKNDSELIQSIAQLSITIEKLSDSKTEQPTFDQLSNELQRHPYSSELCINFLEKIIKLSQDLPNNLNKTIDLINEMPLSLELNLRRDAILKQLHAHIDIDNELPLHVSQSPSTLNIPSFIANR
ncbi:response regulator [Aliivibrio fischeri]|uniref:response regulator n=1 Tax=Aliivibrio fischeri TaxID=668 RepID=UPI0012D9C5FE|nr:response regulator [Aliivibrio fischeri]MUK38724.1 response regulator [Aliivibrio fischeri]MUL04834.1 response regulator [Aliivibrio fischeri]